MAGEKKKSKKAGKNAKKCQRYRANNTREKHKITKIARSNGVKWALKYAADHALSSWAKIRLVKAGYDLQGT